MPGTICHAGLHLLRITAYLQGFLGELMSENNWTAYRKSSLCDSASCIEMKHNNKEVVVRDSKSPMSNVLRFTASAWTAFLTKLK